MYFTNKRIGHRGHEVGVYGKGCGFSSHLKLKCSEYSSMNWIIEEGNLGVGSSGQLVLCWVVLGAKCSGAVAYEELTQNILCIT